jgi:hypothetical protein
MGERDPKRINSLGLTPAGSQIATSCAP